MRNKILKRMAVESIKSASSVADSFKTQGAKIYPESEHESLEFRMGHATSALKVEPEAHKPKVEIPKLSLPTEAVFHESSEPMAPRPKAPSDLSGETPFAWVSEAAWVARVQPAGRCDDDLRIEEL